ncbi:MAG: peptidoglycan DD-metalloendopeptidase family protein [Hyphomicrobium sp.]|nr:peptidoglycan DD-metalloendopeptidase family protein [Hyphomicrobium sp.]
MMLAVWAVSPVGAQSLPEASPEETERALEDKRRALEETESKAKALQSDVTDLDTERERLNARLVETAALIQKSEAQLTTIEGRMSELEAQERIVRGSLGQRHGQIAKLLVALQRMGRNPPPVLITRREDALKMVRSAMLLSSAFPDLKNQALALSERLNDLVRVMTDIRSEGERLQSETDRLNEARTRLASLMEAKKLTIADRQSELVAVRAASAEIAKSVTDLSELISKLDRTVTEKTGLGAYEKELKTAASATPDPVPPRATSDATLAPTPDAAPPAAFAVTGTMAAIGATPETDTEAGTGPVAGTPAAGDPAAGAASAPSAETTETKVAGLQPPKLKPQIIELAPSQAALMPGSPGRIKPAIPFATARSKLPLPAQGRRVLAFGEKTQYGGQSKGMVLETRSSAQVVAPCDGWVVYAGEFRSYGQLLIINAGDGYHVLLAGMSQIDVQPGQFVLTAEPVGTMSGGTKNSSVSVQSNAPVLYVEFRKDGRPIDPDPWWIASQQKVQG